MAALQKYALAGVELLIIPLDIRENLVLTAITRALDGGEAIAQLLRELHIAACWLSGSAGSVAQRMSAATALFFLYFTVRAIMRLRQPAQWTH